MKRSTDRIITTHVGSLPRPHDLLDVHEREGQRPPLRRAGLRSARQVGD